MLATMAMLAGGTLAQGATLEVIGEAQPFLPDAIARAGQELQATVHPVEKLVVFGCRQCEGQQGTDLFATTDRGGGWIAASRSPVSRRGNEALPSFSSDGYWLYFVDDREGGFGGTDLLRAHFTPYKGLFAPPERLEGSINSKGDEGGAAANADGATTIFASKGRKGAKGWDLFVSRRTGGRMSEAERLDALDTAADEFDPALLANDAGLVFARSEALDAKPSSLWFAPRKGAGFGTPVKLGAAINAPGSSVRGAQQDWSDPGYLLFTRDGDVLRIRYRVSP
jgi:hypothetical protein